MPFKDQGIESSAAPDHGRRHKGGGMEGISVPPVYMVEVIIPSSFSIKFLFFQNVIKIISCFTYFVNKVAEIRGENKF